MRGNDGAVRAFHNVCRHRASRLLDGPRGTARAASSVPTTHGPTISKAGLASVGDRSAFPHLDIARESLVPVEMEIYAGFVFARIQGGGPTVAQMMAPYADEIATHEFEKLEPIGRVTLRPRNVNWKNVGDNYSDAPAHPGGAPGPHAAVWRDLPRRVARVDRPHVGRAQRQAVAQLGRAHVPEVPAGGRAPAGRTKRRSWVYFKLWPNFAFDVYPDQVDIMQWLPISPTETLIREIGYARPDERREMRVARYCNWRINRQVNEEDRVLIERVQNGMASGSYRVGPLAAGEVALRSFGKRMRTLIPECREPAPPAAGWSRRRGAG